jgi:hypothetical protein
MKYLPLLISILYPLITYGQTAADSLLAASIKYHDPNDEWTELRAIMGFSDTRPGKPDRSASFFINNPDGIYCIVRDEDDVQVTRHVVNGKVSYELNGTETISEEDIKTYNLTSERSLMLRNYYLYLWGMPMKLKDPGTIIDHEIYLKNFNNEKTNAIRVTYEAEVGSDIWYFYFNPDSNELVGYQFYHDEKMGDGEYIILEDSMKLNGLSIPKNRSWYTNKDSTLLGTDRLVHFTNAHNHH